MRTGLFIGTRGAAMKAKKNRPYGRGTARTHAIICLLMVCCLLAAMISGYFIVQQTREYKEGNTAYQSVRDLARHFGQPVLPQPDSREDTPFVSEIDFESLLSVNGDTVAWLQAENTLIDYPVVQGQDNSHYLGHLFTGERNKLGTLFLDHRNKLFQDPVSVIYGHNMRDKSMLTSIARYVDQEYYDQHPVMTLYLPGETYSVEIIAGITVSGSSDILRFHFDDEADFLDYVQTLRKQSDFVSPVEPGPSDRVLALVTCTYSFQNARYILFGKLEKIS